MPRTKITDQEGNELAHYHKKRNKVVIDLPKKFVWKKTKRKGHDNYSIIIYGYKKRRTEEEE